MRVERLRVPPPTKILIKKISRKCIFVTFVVNILLEDGKNGFLT